MADALVARAEALGVPQAPSLFNVGGSTTLGLLCEMGNAGRLGRRINDFSSGSCLLLPTAFDAWTTTEGGGYVAWCGCGLALRAGAPRVWYRRCWDVAALAALLWCRLLALRPALYFAGRVIKITPAARAIPFLGRLNRRLGLVVQVK